MLVPRPRVAQTLARLFHPRAATAPKANNLAANRGELDRLAQTYQLSAADVATLLTLADAQPSAGESRRFLAKSFAYGGVLSLAAGIIFFIAANWSRFAIFGRFALIEMLIVAAAAAAIIKPPPALPGRAGLFLAYMATGALFALFGQTYQTGADVYELFLTWAMVGLPWVLLAQWSAVTAAWLLTLNTALALYCGSRPSSGLLWMMFDSGLATVHVVLYAALVNLALWVGMELRELRAAPLWVRRLTLTCAFAFLTTAGVMALFAGGYYGGRGANVGLPLLLVFLLMGATAAFAVWRRADVYPLAAALGSFIIVSTCAIANALEFDDISVIFALALWLILTSTVGARVLMSVVRRWRDTEVA